MINEQLSAPSIKEKFKKIIFVGLLWSVVDCVNCKLLIIIKLTHFVSD